MLCWKFNATLFVVPELGEYLMTLVSNLFDDIPGLLKAALIFNGETPGGKCASLAILTDGDAEALIDLSGGLNVRSDGLTQAMRSYISGLSQVGQVLKARKIEDEDGVTEDDLERAALLFAFPKVAQNVKALGILKAHLDALQNNDIIAKSDGSSPAPKSKPEVEARQEPEEDADISDYDTNVVEKIAEAAAPLTLVGGVVAAPVTTVLDDDVKEEVAAKVTDETSDDNDDVAEDVAAATEQDEDVVEEVAAKVTDETSDDNDDVAEDVAAATEKDEDVVEEVAAKVTDETSDDNDDVAEDVAAASEQDEDDNAVMADAPPRPSPAFFAQARIKNESRKPSFFGR
jgi:hypothetical protein